MRLFLIEHVEIVKKAGRLKSIKRLKKVFFLRQKAKQSTRLNATAAKKDTIPTSLFSIHGYYDGK